MITKLDDLKIELIKDTEFKSGQDLYENYKSQESKHSKGIKKDVPRTRNVDLQPIINDQSGLFNILNAYAQFDPEVGYTQGLNFIAAVILKYMENEEDSFFMLIYIMQKMG